MSREPHSEVISEIKIDLVSTGIDSFLLHVLSLC